MTVFSIYYKEDGSITAYAESLVIPPDSECPPGSKRLCLDRVMNIWNPTNHAINMKVDPATLHLLPIDCPNILISEASPAQVQVSLSNDPNKELSDV